MQANHPKRLGFCLPRMVLPLFLHRPISRLCPLSSTVPQKGLLPRHQLERFFLLSVYFPFQGRVGIGSYSNSYFSKLILNFIRCSVWRSSSAFWLSGFPNHANYPTPNNSLLLPPGWITQFVWLEQMRITKQCSGPGEMLMSEEILGF